MGRNKLEALARLYGVEAGYHDISGTYREATDESILSLLRAVGAPVAGMDDLDAALRAEDWRRAGQVLEPVQVVWRDQAPQVRLRLLDTSRVGTLTLYVEGPGDHRDEVQLRLDEAQVVGEHHVDHRRFVDLAVPLSEMPPVGYGTVTVELGSMRHEGRLLVAPRRVQNNESRLFGAFLPTYALKAEGDRGIGDVSQLSRLATWAGRHGARFLGTLPLLSTFLETPFEPSPYVPVSKRFWNEAFLDPSALPEATPAMAEALRGLENVFLGQEFVDFQHGYRKLREVLEHCCAAAWEGPAREELERYAAESPLAQNYARFRAQTEVEGAGWPVWSTREPTTSPQMERYHLYVQYRFDQQLRTAAKQLADQGVELYLDLPLGVHPDGFDAYAEHDAFIQGFSAGAPPDALAPEGQDWGFRPMHPLRLRERGWDYFAESVRQQAEIAGVLRIDHVMGLHRVYCVPIGGSAQDGSYIRFPAEELWAVVCIESELNQCLVVGEDLGTVPDAVRGAMDEHGTLRMYVSQFEVAPGRQPLLTPVSRDVVASINTHDTPTFMGFWHHRDILERAERGVLNPDQTEAAHRERDGVRQTIVDGLRQEGRLHGEIGPSDILVAMLLRLVESPANLVMVNLEDLWLEEAPQNVPGTSWQRPNWKRRMRLTLEQLEGRPELAELFQVLASKRS